MKIKTFLQRFIILFVWFFVNYYAYCFFIIPCLKTNKNKLFGEIFLIYWSLLSFIWLLSYFYVSWFDPGSVECEKRKLMKKNIYDLEKQLSYIRRCEKCGIEKPNRAHHCSKCGKCYIRFDHHCPTVGNCIAYLNIQPFALYLSYGALILFSLSFISGISFVFSSPISTSIASSLSVLYFLL